MRRNVKLEKLVESGFEGVDVDLETSLCEYGIAWRVDEEKREIIFYFDTHNNNFGVIYFDWSSVSLGVDLKKEFDWVDWDEFMDSLGTTFEEWSKWGDVGLGRCVADLVNHYGEVNVFGEYEDFFRFTITDSDGNYLTRGDC